MRFISFLKWLRWFFGFGPKQEKKVIVVDIETGGFDSKTNPIYPTEGYKAEHKKHQEAMDNLLDKIEQNNKKNIQSQGDDFDKRLNELKEAHRKHYRREKVEVKKAEPRREIVIIEPSESVMPLIIGFDPSNEIIDEAPIYETPTYDSPIEFNGGFDGGGFSGGGAGADYSSNSDSSNYSSGSDYSSSSNYDDSPNRDDY